MDVILGSRRDPLGAGDGRCRASARAQVLHEGRGAIFLAVVELGDGPTILRREYMKRPGVRSFASDDPSKISKEPARILVEFWQFQSSDEPSGFRVPQFNRAWITPCRWTPNDA